MKIVSGNKTVFQFLKRSSVLLPAIVISEDENVFIVGLYWLGFRGEICTMRADLNLSTIHPLLGFHLVWSGFKSNYTLTFGFFPSLWRWV